MSKEDSTYVLPAASGEPHELARLDEMHIGISSYFSDELALTPIGDPKRILEVGSGSGAWAIQAATKYPDAEVTAIDMSPLPNRPLPSNITFQQLNVNDDLPFAPKSFDVVHVRFVLIHLPNYLSVLHRLLDLIKPGGWFLAEDLDKRVYGDTLREDSQTLLEVSDGYLKLRGHELEIGRLLESRIQDTGLCHKPTSTKISMPLSPGATADGVSPFFRDCFKRSLLAGLPLMARTVPSMTAELIKAYIEDLDDPSRSYYMDLYAISAQKL